MGTTHRWFQIADLPHQRLAGCLNVDALLLDPDPLSRFGRFGHV
jgi:hypothetical protein